jgi:hypothetical protein
MVRMCWVAETVAIAATTKNVCRMKVMNGNCRLALRSRVDNVSELAQKKQQRSQQKTPELREGRRRVSRLACVQPQWIHLWPDYQSGSKT